MFKKNIETFQGYVLCCAFYKQTYTVGSTNVENNVKVTF
jgi:hypothetical protein